MVSQAAEPRRFELHLRAIALRNAIVRAEPLLSAEAEFAGQAAALVRIAAAGPRVDAPVGSADRPTANAARHVFQGWRLVGLFRHG